MDGRADGRADGRTDGRSYPIFDVNYNLWRFLWLFVLRQCNKANKWIHQAIWRPLPQRYGAMRACMCLSQQNVKRASKYAQFEFAWGIRIKWQTESHAFYLLENLFHPVNVRRVTCAEVRSSSSSKKRPFEAKNNLNRDVRFEMCSEVPSHYHSASI